MKKEQNSLKREKRTEKTPQNSKPNNNLIVTVMVSFVSLTQSRISKPDGPIRLAVGVSVVAVLILEVGGHSLNVG